MAEHLADGRAIWLEPTHLHFHRGDKVELKVLRGYAMQKAEMDGSEHLRGVAVNPEGAEIPVQISRGVDGAYDILVFNSGAEGIYTVQVENGPGPGKDYYARVLVPIGHHVHGAGKAMNRGLEIVPETYGTFHPGEAVDLTVLYGGKPAAGAQVWATYHLNEESGFSHTLQADEKGKVRFVFDAKGHWLFQTHVNDNGTDHIATLVVPGVR
ncbi:DUF4198 domain-containing protein [Desulfoscipio geothermicus]|nr:DUF4198 domain-containing protein [Desulfoscipio geothermicus]